MLDFAYWFSLYLIFLPLAVTSVLTVDRASRQLDLMLRGCTTAAGVAKLLVWWLLFGVQLLAMLLMLVWLPSLSEVTAWLFQARR